MQRVDASQALEQQPQQQQQQRDIAIMSCAQFRPEKEHALQIDILRLVAQKLTVLGKSQSELPRMMVVGGSPPCGWKEEPVFGADIDASWCRYQLRR